MWQIGLSWRKNLKKDLMFDKEAACHMVAE
jgi:hypothetical protein